jgi:RNA polymerase sigma factor (sigma-70 family)
MQEPVADQEIDDRALFERYRAHGDREALGILFARHASTAFQVARRFLDHTTDAEDAVQAGFVQVMTKAHQYRGEATVRAWILAIVANVCRMSVRSRQRRLRREKVLSTDIAAPAAEQNISTAANEALQRLPDRYRLPITLRFIGGLTADEIAGALHLPLTTVRSQLDRGVERLRRMLAANGVTVGATALMVALDQASAGEVARPVLLAKVNAVAHAAHVPMAANLGSVVTSWITSLAAKLGVAGFISVLVVAAAIPILCWRTSGPQFPAVSAEPQPIDRPVADLLDHVVDVRLLHDGLSSAMAHINRRLPPNRFLQYAYPHSFERRPRAGVYIDGGPKPVRMLFDEMASQLGLTWEVRRDVVVFSRSLAPERLQSLVDAFERRPDQAKESWRTDAALALAESADLAAFRYLLQQLPRGKDRYAPAKSALEAASPRSGNGWSRHSLICGLADDPKLTEFIGWARGRCDDSFVVGLLGSLRSVDAVPELIKTLQHSTSEPSYLEKLTRSSERWTTAFSVIAALGFIGDSRAVPALLMVADTDLREKFVVRSAALSALAHIGDERAVPLFVRIIDSLHALDPFGCDFLHTCPLLPYPEISTHLTQWTVRGQPLALHPAIDLLGAMRDPSTYIALESIFRAHNPKRSDWTRCTIAVALDGIDEARTKTLISENIEELVRAQPFTWTYVVGGDDKLVERLGDLFANHDLRHDAARTLAAIRLPSATQILIDAVLADPVRGPVSQLGYTRDNRAADVLLRHVSSEFSSEVRAAAASALGTTLDERAWKVALTLAAEEPDDRVRAAAVATVANSGDPDAIAMLSARFAVEPLDEIRATIMDAMCRSWSVPDPAQRAKNILSGLHDRSSLVRAKALAQVGTCVSILPTPIELRDAVIQVLRGDTDAESRRTAARALWDFEVTYINRGADDFHRPVVEALVWSMRNDKNQYVRYECARSLENGGTSVKIGDKDTAMAKEILAKPYPSVGEAAGETPSEPQLKPHSLPASPGHSDF